jgi:hypothetical protein
MKLNLLLFFLFSSLFSFSQNVQFYKGDYALTRKFNFLYGKASYGFYENKDSERVKTGGFSYSCNWNGTMASRAYYDAASNKIDLTVRGKYLKNAKDGLWSTTIKIKLPTIDDYFVYENFSKRITTQNYKKGNPHGKWKMSWQDLKSNKITQNTEINFVNNTSVGAFITKSPLRTIKGSCDQNGFLNGKVTFLEDGIEQISQYESGLLMGHVEREINSGKVIDKYNIDSLELKWYGILMQFKDTIVDGLDTLPYRLKLDYQTYIYDEFAEDFILAALPDDFIGDSSYVERFFSWNAFNTYSLIEQDVQAAKYNRHMGKAEYYFKNKNWNESFSSIKLAKQIYNQDQSHSNYTAAINKRIDYENYRKYYEYNRFISLADSSIKSKKWDVAQSKLDSAMVYALELDNEIYVGFENAEKEERRQAALWDSLENQNLSVEEMGQEYLEKSFDSYLNEEEDNKPKFSFDGGSLTIVEEKKEESAQNNQVKLIETKAVFILEKKLISDVEAALSKGEYNQIEQLLAEFKPQGLVVDSLKKVVQSSVNEEFESVVKVIEGQAFQNFIKTNFDGLKSLKKGGYNLKFNNQGDLINEKQYELNLEDVPRFSTEKGMFFYDQQSIVNFKIEVVDSILVSTSFKSAYSKPLYIDVNENLYKKTKTGLPLCKTEIDENIEKNFAVCIKQYKREKKVTGTLLQTDTFETKKKIALLKKEP